MWSSITSQGSSSRVGARPSIWDVPVSIWAYGLLRSLAFIAPTWTEDGRIGLGVFVVLVLYVFLVRGSSRAWGALVLLDVFSYVMLMAAWFEEENAPLAIPIITGASMAALLVPSTRRHVFVARTQQTTAAESSTTTDT